MAVTQGIAASYTKGKYAEFHYTVTGAASEAAAEAEARAAVPATYESMPLHDLVVDTEHFDSGNASKNIFRVTAKYYYYSTEDGTLVSFDTTGGTQRVTQSLSTIASYPTGAPNLKGAINYDGQRVNGVDIGIGAHDFTLQKYMSVSSVTDAYRRTLASMTYTVNSAKFKGFNAGEVLFKGAVANQVYVNGVKKFQINFIFSSSLNKENFYVGDILVTQKLGWDYLWVIYSDAVNSGRVVKVPSYVYVERLYNFSDFTALGL